MDAHSKNQMTVDREKREIRMTRTFDAPRDLVFKVSLDPALIPQWWGPRSLTTVVDHMDVRPGGSWRFVQRDAEGNEFAFHGEYVEIERPERFVQTFVYEGEPDHSVMETYLFEEVGGKTRVTVRDVFQAVEDLDGMLQSGMQEGAFETNDRLEELLERMASKV